MTKKQFLLPALVIISLLFGYLLGQAKVEAGLNEPGSTADPLVAQSYVQKAVNEKTVALEKQLQELQTKATSLEIEVTKLKAQLAADRTSN